MELIEKSTCTVQRLAVSYSDRAEMFFFLVPMNRNICNLLCLDSENFFSSFNYLREKSTTLNPTLSIHTTQHIYTYIMHIVNLIRVWCWAL